MNLFLESHIKLFERDLKKAMKEISLYNKDEDLWKLHGEIKNSGGNLILHIIGNLRHFIGHVIGGSDYERKRDTEFTLKDVPREELILGLKMAAEEIQTTLKQLTDTQLQEKYPMEVLGYEMTTAFFISHLYGHLSYHLGQVNYHRRQIS